MKSKRIILVIAAVLLSAIFTSCGGVKLADTTWKGTDNRHDFELIFTKKEATYKTSYTAEMVKEFGLLDKADEMTAKYTA